MIRFVLLATILVASYSSSRCHAQQSADESSEAAPQLPIPTISEFAPTTKLQVRQTLLTQSKFPSIDAHCHFGRRLRGDADQLAAFVKTMDRHNIAVCVSFDATLGAEQDHLQFLSAHKDRFVSFAYIDFIGSGKREAPKTWSCNQPGFIRQTCLQLVAAQEDSICGLKFFKQFGLHTKKSDGSLYSIDDPKWDPIWESCGRLGLPVIMHTADPSAFFDPIAVETNAMKNWRGIQTGVFTGKNFPAAMNCSKRATA